jgi:hypothetical protein
MRKRRDEVELSVTRVAGEWTWGMGRVLGVALCVAVGKCGRIPNESRTWRAS